jgi:hypothetical protein
MMGYFSNGTEGMMYEERYCSRCVHFKPDDGGCMVWLAHLNGNYKQHDNPALKEVLDLLIPREKDGIGNKECRMFHVENPDRCPDTKDLFS